MLQDILVKAEEQQRPFLWGIALGLGEARATRVSRTKRDDVRQWKQSEGFKQLVDEIRAGDYVAEAVRLWVNDRIFSYLENVDDLALKAKTERVKLEASKYLIGLAGGDRGEVKELSTIERYLEDGRTEKEIHQRVRSVS